jgi:hypothetical protein
MSMTRASRAKVFCRIEASKVEIEGWFLSQSAAARKAV